MQDRSRKASSRRAWNRSSDHRILCGWLCETDGPLSTVAVAEALNHLGFHSVVVTDKYCKGFFELKQLDVEYVDIAADEQVYEDILDKYNPVYMISIERCGENAEHEYANMCGVSITSETAAIDHLFELAPEKHIPTIGVGDGGNEIGMGNVKDIISEKLELNPCVVPVDDLILQPRPIGRLCTDAWLAETVRGRSTLIL